MKREMMIVLLMSVAIMVPGNALVAEQLTGSTGDCPVMLGSIQCKPCPLEDETFYLSDSADAEDGITILYQVGLDRWARRAHLYPLPEADLDPPLGPGVIPFNQADALAATPDGKKLLVIDRYDGDHTGGHLGCYVMENASWVDRGLVTLDGEPVAGIVLAAFSPNGCLYVASYITDSLYTLDVNTAELTLVGVIKKDGPDGTTVDLHGADIVFAEDGTLYLWTNLERADAPRGLYVLNLPPVGAACHDPTVVAIYVGTSTDSFFTGLATKEICSGHLVGSTRQDEIWIIDETTGLTIGPPFMMHLGGLPYEYEFGDMTTGPSVLCTRTIGYWKNHSWEDETITICDVVIDEALGKEILWNARGSDFSMLFAQLIAAKLNCSNCSFQWIIDYMELWLCRQPGIVRQDGTLYWDMPFQSDQQKRVAEWIWSWLDCFNNGFECE